MSSVEESMQVKRTPAPFQTEEFRRLRPSIVGPEEPEAPFPIKLVGLVQKGFGRGGKDLGCPTGLKKALGCLANLPDDSTQEMTAAAKTGVYYGYAQVISPSDKVAEFEEKDLVVLPMVMSMGYNPFYDNKKLTAEIHIMHSFKSDFYGYEMRVIVLGYIRPELNYTSREALIDDIDTDKRVALQSLERRGYQQYAQDGHFKLE